jgi:hypothetical protein
MAARIPVSPDEIFHVITHCSIGVHVDVVQKILEHVHLFGGDIVERDDRVRTTVEALRVCTNQLCMLLSTP